MGRVLIALCVLAGAGDVKVGTSGADRLVGKGGRDVLIGRPGR